MDNLKVIHWNCFALTSVRQVELVNFINFFKPDIISLQEIKLKEELSNLRLNINGFTTYVKARSDRGGGVAILIRSEIPHSPISDLDCNLEIVGLKIDTSEFNFDFYSLYNPPSKLLPQEFFNNLESNKRKFVLTGDLNSKTEVIGCKGNNKNGEILERILTNTSTVIHNNLSPTFNRFNSEYYELLDLVLSSHEISNKITGLEVLSDHDMGSDHFPVLFHINVKRQVQNNQEKNTISRFNLNKADWGLFRFHLEGLALAYSSQFIESLSIDELNDLVINNINQAATLSIPKYVVKNNNSLPFEIVQLIQQKRIIRKEFRKTKHPYLKLLLNKITNEVKALIRNHKEKTWKFFLDKIGPHPVSSRPFWAKINQARTANKAVVFPTLEKNNQFFKTSEEKAHIFSKLLSTTFNDEGNDNEFDSSFKEEVNMKIRNYTFENSDFVPFTSGEIYSRIYKIKVNTSPGEDEIQNVFLKNIPFEYVKKILSHLINRAISSGIPKKWKKAKIIMIPKKEGMSRDPEKYRPISLTSCLSKLTERLVKTRLCNFLESNDFFVMQQSGFRNNKGASDNLTYFTQKLSENINRGKKAVGIFFDISKAFDKVWHNGLLFKLLELNPPKYMVNFIRDFLNKRSFSVQIEGHMSEECSITCSVPQGSVLGPLLFLIYINDIPIADRKHYSCSSLFADDLATIFFFKKTGNISKKINLYLQSLVRWLYKYRLKMNAEKCCYTVFSGNGNKDQTFLELNLKNGLIPYNPKPTFLGILFDEFLCFKEHVESLRRRALKRLNLIKIFSHKSWQLDHKTLKCIYDALIGSIFTYSFFSIARISKTNMNKLQTVQNRAIRSIYRLDWCSPVDLIHELSGLSLVEDRLTNLGKKYISIAEGRSELIELLISEYNAAKSTIQKNNKITPLCLFLGNSQD
jgi:endonuclease/exonuclease/phosphatase family metal-dependent hydrolase